MSIPDQIPETIRAIGDAQASGLRAKGQLYGSLITNLADAPSEYMAAQAKKKAAGLDAALKQQELTVRQTQIAQQQRAQAVQDQTNTAYSNAFNDDGTIDNAKLLSGLKNTTAASKAPEIIKGITDAQEQGLRVSELRAKVNEAEQAHMSSIANAADAVDDPMGKATVLAASIDSGVKSGAIAPDHAAALKAELTGPDGQLNQDAVGPLIARMKQLSAVDLEKRATAARVTQEGARATQDAKAKDEALATSNAATQLAGATTQADYARRYQGLPAAVQAKFDPPETFDPKTTPQRARFVAMTPDQQATVTAQQTTADRLAGTAAETARHNRTDEDLARQRLEKDKNAAVVVGAGIPDVPAGQKNDAFIATLPAEQAALVKALAEGRKSFPTGTALKSDYWQNMLGAVAKYDPSFDEVNYNSRSKTRQAFTSGPESKQVNAINTAIGHLDDLSDAAERLNNFHQGTFGPLTQAANSIKTTLQKNSGNPVVNDFNTFKKTASDEITRIWRQSGGSEKDVEAAEANLSQANTPEELRGAIADYSRLMESKLTNLSEQYRQGMGTDKIDMLTPKSQSTLNKIEARKSGRPATPSAVPPASAGTVRARDPQGVLHEAPAGTPLPAGWTPE